MEKKHRATPEGNREFLTETITPQADCTRAWRSARHHLVLHQPRNRWPGAVPHRSFCLTAFQQQDGLPVPSKYSYTHQFPFKLWFRALRKTQERLPKLCAPKVFLAFSLALCVFPLKEQIHSSKGYSQPEFDSEFRPFMTRRLVLLQKDGSTHGLDLWNLLTEGIKAIGTHAQTEHRDQPTKNKRELNYPAHESERSKMPPVFLYPY